LDREPVATTEMGDHAAQRLDDLYRQHGARIYRYALAVLGNHADAEDVTQTTFLNAYGALEQGVRPRKPESWLLAIASNAIKQRFRQESARPRQVELAEDLADAAPEADGPTVGELLAALAKIPPQQRQALVLREFEGRSYAEIAEILGVTQSALETLLFRARRSLAEELESALSCTDAQLAISKAVDQRLGRKERRRLREHLAECPDCARFARLQQRNRAALKGLLLVPVPVSLSLLKSVEGTAAASVLPAGAAAGATVAGAATAVGAGASAGATAVGGGLFASGLAVKAAAVVSAAAVTGGIAVTGASVEPPVNAHRPPREIVQLKPTGVPAEARSTASERGRDRRSHGLERAQVARHRGSGVPPSRGRRSHGLERAQAAQERAVSKSRARSTPAAPRARPERPPIASRARPTRPAAPRERSAATRSQAPPSARESASSESPRSVGAVRPKTERASARTGRAAPVGRRTTSRRETVDVARGAVRKDTSAGGDRPAAGAAPPGKPAR
jgi:RNA polymerase sigma factor (sigma-70 family)